MNDLRAELQKRAVTFAEWVFLGALVGALAGVASALFLVSLEYVTKFREAHEAIVYALPISGLFLGFFYDRWGKTIAAGNNLVLDTIHDVSPQIPIRMAPMVFLGTVLTHLFGGSAGREGTAVQMGASLADFVAHRFRVSKETRRQLLAAGIAGGFGSVFGTPIAGTLFGLEVVCIGRIEYDALAPALISALVGDYVTKHLGIMHTVYPTVSRLALTPSVFGKLCVVGVAMGLVTLVFIELTHRLKRVLAAKIASLPLRMFVGGAAVVVMWRVVGTNDYLGLGVPMIVRSFRDMSLPTYAFAAKILFTSVTLACGFVGGEVTPLFFIGATLGSVLARVLGLPIEIGAGVGLAAVFGAAANTPLALSVMAVELVGAAIFPHAVIVCVIAYLVTGHRGIYPAQRILRRKQGGSMLPSPVALRDFHDPIDSRSAPSTPTDR